MIIEARAEPTAAIDPDTTFAFPTRICSLPDEQMSGKYRTASRKLMRQAC